MHQLGIVSFEEQKTNCAKFTPSGQLFIEEVWRWEHRAGYPSPRLFLSICFTDMTIIPLCLQTHHFIPEPWLLKPQQQVLPLCSKGGTSGRVENRAPEALHSEPNTSQQSLAGRSERTTWPLTRKGSWESGHQEGSRNVTIGLTQPWLFFFRWPTATELRRSLPTN